MGGGEDEDKGEIKLLLASRPRCCASLAVLSSTGWPALRHGDVQRLTGTAPRSASTVHKLTRAYILITYSTQTQKEEKANNGCKKG